MILGSVLGVVQEGGLGVEPRTGAQWWVGGREEGYLKREEFLHLFSEKKSPDNRHILGSTLTFMQPTIM